MTKLAVQRAATHKANAKANKWEKRAKAAERLLNPDFTFKIVNGEIKIKDLPEGYGE